MINTLRGVRFLRRHLLHDNAAANSFFLFFFDIEVYVSYTTNYTQVYHVAHIIVYNYIII